MCGVCDVCMPGCDVCVCALCVLCVCGVGVGYETQGGRERMLLRRFQQPRGPRWGQAGDKQLSGERCSGRSTPYGTDQVVRCLASSSGIAQTLELVFWMTQVVSVLRSSTPEGEQLLRHRWTAWGR